MSKPNIKPCPFCGAEARLEIRGYDHKREYRVACSAVNNCGGSQYWFDKQREAVAAWNRRAAPARNCDRPECWTADGAARVYRKETEPDRRNADVYWPCVYSWLFDSPKKEAAE